MVLAGGRPQTIARLRDRGLGYGPDCARAPRPGAVARTFPSHETLSSSAHHGTALHLWRCCARGRQGHRSLAEGLVYEGAIVENVKGHVQVHAVSYTLGGIDIAANLNTPPNFDPNAQYAAIAVAHPNGGTREQVAGLYAQLLAEQGFVTIAADVAFKGESGGLPRHKDTPESRTSDLHGMVDHLSTLPYVDPDRIGLLGVCGAAATPSTRPGPTSA